MIKYNKLICLNELEAVDWGKPNSHDTNLVTRCKQLRYKPLSEFQADDLRVLIGQKISLDILIPIAIELLQANPLLDSEYYPGDLLTALFNCQHQTYYQRISTLAEQALRLIDIENDQALKEKCLEFLKK